MAPEQEETLRRVREAHSADLTVLMTEAVTKLIRGLPDREAWAGTIVAADVTAIVLGNIIATFAPPANRAGLLARAEVTMLRAMQANEEIQRGRFAMLPPAGSA